MNSKYKILFLLAAASMLLSGCGIYTTYQRDGIPNVDSLYRSDSDTPPAAMAGDSHNADTVPHWSDFFTDARLRHLIEQGMAGNADLRIARQNIDKAQAALSAAPLAYLPSLAIGADASSDHFNQTTKNVYSLAAEASWQIDIFGRVTNARRAAKARLLESEAYAQAVQSRLVATIVDSYYSLLLLDAQMDIAAQTLANWRKAIATMAALKGAGRSNEAAVQQATAQMLTLEADSVSLRHDIYVLENSLCALLMIPPQHIERGTLQQTAIPAMLGTGVPASLLENRPDLRQAEARLMQLFYNVQEARGAFFPSLTLSGAVGWTNSHSGITVDPAQIFANVAGSLLQPILGRGSLKTALRTAEADREAALIAYQQTILLAADEVNNALSLCQTSASRITLDSARVAALTQAVEHTTSLMNYGSSSYLEVLTAQQSLLAAQQSLAENRYRRLAALANLYQAIGGGTEKQ